MKTIIQPTRTICRLKEKRIINFQNHVKHKTPPDLPHVALTTATHRTDRTGQFILAFVGSLMYNFLEIEPFQLSIGLA